jgi:hypothetical protein
MDTTERKKTITQRCREPHLAPSRIQRILVVRYNSLGTVLTGFNPPVLSVAHADRSAQEIRRRVSPPSGGIRPDKSVMGRA